VRRCFESLARADLEGVGARVIAVDNGSSDATAELVREFAWVELVETGRNLGFAGGNNVGIALALQGGAEYVYLLNPDTDVDGSFLAEAVAVAERDPQVGAVQSLLLLGAERDLVNTAGNEIHFLGFGYCGRLGAARATIADAPAEIAFASGAGVLLSAAALRASGLFDDTLFLYQEDLDLGWRLRLAGYRSVLAPRSLVWHHYEFTRNRDKYYYLERNRYLVLAKNLRLRSLLVLAPFLLASEAGLLGIAASSGWLGEKLRADAHLMKASTWRHVRASRAGVARLRRVADRDVARWFTSDLRVDGAPGAWIPRLLGIPMSLAWRALRPLLG
jgi:GT2 family glycosyltransferase